MYTCIRIQSNTKSSQQINKHKTIARVQRSCTSYMYVMLNQRLKNRYNYNAFNIAFYKYCSRHFYAEIFLLFLYVYRALYDTKPNLTKKHNDDFSAYCAFLIEIISVSQFSEKR